MRLHRCSSAGLVATILLFVLQGLFASPAADAATFDCKRASLQVDFVICRSEEGRRAIDDLTEAWEKVTAAATPDRKAALLDQQRRWIGVYPLLCGLTGRGPPAPDPTLRTDKCVAEQLRKRMSALQSTASLIASRGADSPAAFLQELYSPYEQGGSTSVLDGNAELYFAPPLAKAFRADLAASRRTNSTPRFDGDVLVPSQEGDRLSDLQIQTVTFDPMHARGLVSYRTSKKAWPTALTIDLILLERGWRISSILYPTAQAALAEILAGVSLSAAAPDCAFHPTLSIDTQTAMKAGEWLPIHWSRCAATTRIDEPTFLVIAVPDAVRLRGPGFYALRPHARAPFSFEFENNFARIIIPLHQPLEPALGTVEVQPAFVGELPIEAAVFQRDHERNVVLWRSKHMVKAVTPGSINIGVWQEVSSEAPKEVRQSNDGRWELRIYQDSYEVIDTRTGDLVIRRAGSDPAFSPTQRFLIAKTGEGYDEIVDLVTQRVIRQHVGNFLIWVHEDSFALENKGRACNVSVIETLVDETGDFGDPIAFPGSFACDAWLGSQVDLSIDAGHIANSTQGNEPSFDVASLARLPVQAHAFPGDVLNSVPVQWMRATFDKSYAGPPRIWRLHDALKIVSSDEHPGFDQYDRSLRPFMISASHVVTEHGAIQLVSDAERRAPVTRGLVRGEVAQAKSLEKTLGYMLGIPTMPIVVAERATVQYQPNYSETEIGRLKNQSAAVGAERKNVFGLPATPILDKTRSCDEHGIGTIFVKAGDIVLQAPDVSTGGVSQIAYWRSPTPDVVVLSSISAGTEDGGETTRILRQGSDKQWFSDCRHEKAMQPDEVTVGHHVAAHAGEIPPVPFRFPSDEIGLLYVVDHELLLSPASQSDPVCNLRYVRDPETLQTVARVGSNLVLLLNRTGDLDLFECPSGRHVISGALLDDELLVYTDQGWFDGSAEAASFVQVRLAGVPGRYPLAQFEDALRRPGVLKDAVEGKAEPPVAISDPPYVRLDSRGKTVIAGDGKDLKALRFYDDGVMVAETAIGGRQGSVPIPPDKLADARQAAVVAVNAADVQSAPLPLPSLNPATSRKGRLLGLAVGLDRYSDWQIPELHFAEQDASAIADALNRYDRANVEASVASLTGAAATTATILSSVRAKVAEATPADTLVFSFAGHGIAENGNLFLLTFDTDYGDLWKTGLNWSDLEAAFAQSKARIVVFLDACQSGTAALGSGDQHEVAIDRLKNWTGPPMLIFAASKGSQAAAEIATAGGGLFTSALVEALRVRAEAGPSAPLLTLNELYASAKRRVIAENRDQIPWFGRRGLFGNFILF